MKAELEKQGIKTKFIIDSAIGSMVGDVDCVITGAEAVVENGGIINKVRKGK
jgi:translation initiation factor eIF-2B subunit alpha